MRKDEREPILLHNQGQKLFGVFHRPLTDPPHPAVLSCHGFGGHKTGRFRMYVLFAELLAQVGIATLRLDFRCCGDSEGDIEEMTLHGNVEDALVGVEFLQNHSKIDSERLGFFGRSLGGAVATIAASQCPATKSLSLWAPVFNGDQWRELWERTQEIELNEEQRKELLAVNGQLSGEPFYHELFDLDLFPAIKKLDQIPMLFIHPEHDDVVHIHHTDQYLRCRQNAEAKTECVRLPKSDHDFSHFDEREASLQETVAWFKETL